MAAVKQKIGEIDYVEFKEEIDKVESTGKWPAGTRGTVVDDYGDHKMVEILNNLGLTLDLLVVAEAKLKLIRHYQSEGRLVAMTFNVAFCTTRFTLPLDLP